MCVNAKSTPRESAREVTRFAPPGFLETMTQFFQSTICSRIHLAREGSAKRLSQGMEKKPCIWDAWRSIVMTWLTPAIVNRFATTWN
jgi:hypothetical protein